MSYPIPSVKIVSLPFLHLIHGTRGKYTHMHDPPNSHTNTTGNTDQRAMNLGRSISFKQKVFGEVNPALLVLLLNRRLFCLWSVSTWVSAPLFLFSEGLTQQTTKKNICYSPNGLCKSPSHSTPMCISVGLHCVLAATTGSCFILHQISLKMEVKIKSHPFLHTAALGRRHSLPFYYS